MKASELVSLLKAQIQDWGDMDVRMGPHLENGVYDVQARTYSGEWVMEIEGRDYI